MLNTLEAAGVSPRELIAGAGGWRDPKIVRMVGYGFQQPGPADPVLDAAANPIESHDPTNPSIEIPKIGLPVAAQVRCVELAIARMIGMNVSLAKLSRLPGIAL